MTVLNTHDAFFLSPWLNSSIALKAERKTKPEQEPRNNHRKPNFHWRSNWFWSRCLLGCGSPPFSATASCDYQEIIIAQLGKEVEKSLSLGLRPPPPQKIKTKEHSFLVVHPSTPENKENISPLVNVFLPTSSHIHSLFTWPTLLYSGAWGVNTISCIFHERSCLYNAEWIMD